MTDGNSDFVSFVRKTGSSQDLNGRGGTYGYGKAVFHLVSAPRTVLVHTRCRIAGRLETRLIGWAVHESYSTETVNGPKTFTGRHYWGQARDGYIEPLVDDQADEIARRLGLPPFPHGETGTTVAIVDPTFGEREDAEAMRWIADSMVWNLWPKMLPEGGNAPMRFSALHDGSEVRIPRPSEVPHLRPFLWAHGQMDRELHHKSLRRTLGRLGVRRFLAPSGPPPKVAIEAGIGDRIHHTCLMRPVDLVVRYLEGPPFFEEHGGYAAVFRADPGMDRVFAATEPASHDDWKVDRLQGEDHRLARHTLRQITDAMREASSPAAVVNHAGEGVSLAGMSQLMAGLMAGAPGEGGSAVFDATLQADAPGPVGTGGTVAGIARTAEPGTSFGEATPGQGGARIRYLEEPRLDSLKGQTVLVQRFQLVDPGEQIVRGRLSVALADGVGREDIPPQGAAIPTVLGWCSDDGDVRRTEDLHTTGGNGAVWSLLVRPAPDTVTEILVTSDGKEGSA